MAKLFGVDIAKIVNQEISPGLLEGTLTHEVPGTRTTGNLAGGTNPTTSTHSFKGIQEDLSVFRPEELNEEATAGVLIVVNSLSPTIVPVIGDKVVFAAGDPVMRILSIKKDPASATLLCQVA